MIDGHRVIAFTPCGRKRYMDVLARYVAREVEAGHIDEWALWVNPKDQDKSYAHELAGRFPFVKLIDIDLGKHRFKKYEPLTLHLFYQYMPQERDAIFVRLDDDLVYIAPDCLPKLVRYRLANPQPFLVYPTIINNSRTSYALQQRKLVPNAFIGPGLLDRVSWETPRFAESLHRRAIPAIRNGGLQQFTLPSEQFTDYETGNISINCYAMLGSDMVEHTPACHSHEENYISIETPKRLNRQNARCGDAFVVHFAYYTQTDHMDRSGLLEEYASLAP